ncbi:MAG: hypothetical protein BRD50_01610 [Bacteroidetes bacterium SW_11_45_7]|nr:MAG: hypothetical protein BRD50_01610 [Bacteroidetes bacterium SW_11_45_7]
MTTTKTKERATDQARSSMIAAANGPIDQTVLSANEQTIISILAGMTPLPAKDIYHVLHDQLPNLTWHNLRAYLANCNANLFTTPYSFDDRQDEGVPETRLLMEIIDICCGKESEYLVIAFDQQSMMLFAEVLPSLQGNSVEPFIAGVRDDLPYRISAVANRHGDLLLDEEQVAALYEREEESPIDREWVNKLPITHKLLREKDDGAVIAATPSNDMPRFTDRLKYFIWKYNFGKSLKVLGGNSPYGDVVRKLNKRLHLGECMDYFIKLFNRFPHFEFQDNQLSEFIRNQ